MWISEASQNTEFLVQNGTMATQTWKSTIGLSSCEKQPETVPYSTSAESLQDSWSYSLFKNVIKGVFEKLEKGGEKIIAGYMQPSNLRLKTYRDIRQ